jgi:hypothetical protein
MVGLLELLLCWLTSLVKSRRRLRAEHLVLRHQLNILRRRAARRVRLCDVDRLVFVWLYRLWSAVAHAVTIVKPETIIGSVGTDGDTEPSGAGSRGPRVAGHQSSGRSVI